MSAGPGLTRARWRWVGLDLPGALNLVGRVLKYLAGLMGTFEPFSPFAKVVMILLMWAGRLEIVPVAVLLTRRYWRA